jgi:sodium-dependent phosphate cotransporter
VSDEEKPEAQWGWASLRWFVVLSLVYLLLVGVASIGGGFKWISGGAEGAAEIFRFASNPLVGVILGILATALIQSSSTVSSVIVGLVAGGVPVSVAIPMIMGANIGTTITNTIVSLGHLRHRLAFRQSFEAATVHDLFNLFAVAIFLPLEVLFHPLERSAHWLASSLNSIAGVSFSDVDPISAATQLPAKILMAELADLPGHSGATLTIVIGVALVIGAVLLLGAVLRRSMTGRARGIITAAIGRGPLRSIASGTIVTVLVQSSSTTTSLVVPLAGEGVLTTRQIYPFTLGANIGTCITALLAALAASGVNAIFALEIALVHLLYNVAGVILFMSIPWLRELPLQAAAMLGDLVERRRSWALAYLGVIFFALPGAVLSGQMLLRTPCSVIPQAMTEPDPRSTVLAPASIECVVDAVETRASTSGDDGRETLLEVIDEQLLSRQK